jgi:hypothetical protein
MVEAALLELAAGQGRPAIRAAWPSSSARRRISGRRISPARDSTETGFRAVRAETGELRLRRGPFNR